MGLNTGYLTAKTDKDSDEVYTPAYAVKPIIKYIKKDATVWCPFDFESSEYVRLIRENGNKVIATHIDTGQNFFYYEPEEHYDVIVSNPPFSVKDAIIKIQEGKDNLKKWENKDPMAIVKMIDKFIEENWM